PFRVDMPITVELSSESLQEMYVMMDKPWIGAIRFFTPGHDNDEAVTVWNSAVVERARPYVADGRSLEDVVAQIAGFEWRASESAHISDIRENDDLGARVVRVEPRVAQLENELADMRIRAERAEESVSTTRLVARGLNARTGGRAGRAVRGINGKLGGIPARVVRKLRGLLAR
ncbi:MAG: hypothetical protein ACTIAY_11245, partial [Microbacterium gubbeenense]